MICDVCRKEICGNYVIYEGKNCCSEICYHTLLSKCHKCGKLLEGQYLIFEGNNYCSQQCAMSGNKTNKSTNTHNHTHRTHECCIICKKPLIGKYLILEDKKYCSTQCASVVRPKCNKCNNPIIGQIVEIRAGNKYYYCMECSHDKKCFVCKRPENGITLHDGRFLCIHCNNDTINDKQVANQLFKDVRKILKKEGCATCDSLEFYLVDRTGMKQIAGQRYNERELGLYYNVTENTAFQVSANNPLWGSSSLSIQCSIYVYDNIPRERFIETIAHELGHDWCRHQFGKVVFSPACEGVAEFIASRVNEIMGWERNNQRMENSSDPVYGGGYRMIRDISKQSGENGVITYLRNHLK